MLKIGQGRELLRAALSDNPRHRPTAGRWRNYFADLAAMTAKELHRRRS